MNWSYLGAILPQGIEIIDFYHACEHLKAAFDAAYGENTKLLGHSSVTTTGVYARLAPNEVSEGLAHTAKSVEVSHNDASRNPAGSQPKSPPPAPARVAPSPLSPSDETVPVANPR